MPYEWRSSGEDWRLLTICLEVRDVGKETIIVVVKKEKKKPILCNRLEDL
jgi:hypothetical protein